MLTIKQINKMKESTEQKIREYLEQFRIKFTGEEKPGSSATLAELVMGDDASAPASEEILTNICNIIEEEETITYYPKSVAKKLEFNQKVICKCPHWNEEGFQIAFWNGDEFEFDDQPNYLFDKQVIEFCPIDDDGIPFSL